MYCTYSIKGQGLALSVAEVYNYEITNQHVPSSHEMNGNWPYQKLHKVLSLSTSFVRIIYLLFVSEISTDPVHRECRYVMVVTDISPAPSIVHL